MQKLRRNELRETLARLHDELIEKTVLSALSGDPDGTDEALKLAKDANIRPTMLQLLQGIANYQPPAPHGSTGSLLRPARH